jgi:hypothetical protein
VTAIQCYSNTIWGARNDILHSDTAETTAIVQLRVNTTIYQIYATNKDKFKDANQQFFQIDQFKPSFKDHCKQNSVQPVVDRAKDSEKIGQALITSYLSTEAHTPRPPCNPESITPPPPIAQKQTNLLCDYPFTISFLTSIPD